MSEYPLQMRFHWCAERPHATGLQVSDGYVTITGDPFNPALGEILAGSIETLKGWQGFSFVITSLTLIGTKPVDDGDGQPDTRHADALRLLRELKDILSLCDQGRAGRVHDHMDIQAVACGERDGYGAWMDALQRMWQQRDSVGCFTVGPCLGTVRHAIKRIDALLDKEAAT